MHTRIVILAILIPVIFTIAGYVLVIGLGDVGATAASTTDTRKITLKLTETFDEQLVWVPSTIFLDRGDNVEFTIINGEDDDHILFSIPELNLISGAIPPLNGQGSLTFSAEITGTYNFIYEETCDLGDPNDLEECDVEEESEENDNDDKFSIAGSIVIQE